MITSLVIRQDSLDIEYICYLKILITLALILGFSLSGGDESLIWPPDAYNMHAPNSINFVNTLNGDQNFFWINPNNPFHKIYFSNMYIGFWFKLFDASPVVSAVAAIPFTLGTIYLIYKSTLLIFKDEKIAIIAASLYSLSPTVTFYSVQFYKEFFVQFCVALCVYLSLRLSKERFFAIIPLLTLFLERFYLFFMLICPIALLEVLKFKNKWFQVTLIAASILIVIVFAKYYYPTYTISDFLIEIKKTRDHHNLLPGITQQDNYFIGIVRIIFTPFFNVFKIKNYTNLNSLLTYGSFFHQVTMLFYFIGIFSFRRNKITILNISFFLFIILFGYIEPFNGRVRDSFYPLIVIFSAYGVKIFIGRIMILGKFKIVNLNFLKPK